MRKTRVFDALVVLAMPALSLFASTANAQEVVVMQKQNTSFAVDGNSGAIEGQQVYLWRTETSDPNQQWVELAQGSGFFSYQKNNTLLCLDGGDGGARRQPVTLETCNASSENQHWEKIGLSNGTFRLEKRGTSFSLDGDRNAENLQDVYLWDSRDSNVNQQWEFLSGDSSNELTSCSSFDNLSIQSASSTFPFDASYSPAKAIDNSLDIESRWSSNGVGNSITLDLGETSVVRQLNTAWFRSNIRTALFDVETSTNGTDWQIVASQASVSGTQGLVELDVTDSDARYVRIVGLGNTASEWNSLIEVDVFGCGNVDLPGPGPVAEFPSDVIDASFFRKWNITMGDGSGEGSLVDFENEDYFFSDGDDWVVYKTPNAGSTTPNSPNTRSELRQLQEWTPETGGTMTGTLKVMQVSTSADARFSPSFAVVVGQIHSNAGHKNEPLKIFYKKYPGHDKGSVFWNYEINTEGDNEERWDFSTAVWGDDWSVVGPSATSYPAEPEDGIELGEEFSYEVVVADGIMRLTFEAAGHPTRTFEKNLIVTEYSTTVPDQVLSGGFASTGQDGLERSEAYAGELQYFKQGAYNQTNGKAPEDVGVEGTTFWNTAGDTFDGDLTSQYANGAYTEVWFRAATVSSNNDTTGLFNGGFESNLSGWSEDEPASGSGEAFTGVGAAKIEPGGAISQSVVVIPGEDYTLSAMIKIDTAATESGSASVVVGDETIALSIPSEVDSYEMSTVEFNSGNSNEVTIMFSGGFFRIDDVVLDGPFPE